MANKGHAAFICTEELWACGHGESHPLKPARLRRTFELLSAYRAFSPPHSRLVSPQPANHEQLAYFHSAEYINAVFDLGRGAEGVAARRYNFGPGDNPIFPGMYESEGLKVGAALTAARLINEGEVQVAFSFGGGMHHALAARVAESGRSTHGHAQAVTGEDRTRRPGRIVG